MRHRSQAPSSFLHMPICQRRWDPHLSTGGTTQQALHCIILLIFTRAAPQERHTTIRKAIWFTELDVRGHHLPTLVTSSKTCMISLGRIHIDPPPPLQSNTHIPKTLQFTSSAAIRGLLYPSKHPGISYNALFPSGISSPMIRIRVSCYFSFITPMHDQSRLTIKQLSLHCQL